MAHVKEQGTGLVLLAALLVATRDYLVTDYYHAIFPCSGETCSNYCQKNNYNKNFHTFCTPGQYYPGCCRARFYDEFCMIWSDASPAPASAERACPATTTRAETKAR
ncbi:hypothetical protein SETIT_2G011200v2 [Setaria italica]|uniref:Uncharacterized protein n=1 Tax=Setaria italica TaxID=4555 RepID=A0A368PUW1_SETIT|nr:hypothetical protein SETIT_2G011200v2 [Setaria italica]